MLEDTSPINSPQAHHILKRIIDIFPSKLTSLIERARHLINCNLLKYCIPSIDQNDDVMVR